MHWTLDLGHATHIDSRLNRYVRWSSMSSETTPNQSTPLSIPVNEQSAADRSPKEITNAQTVCNERNEKNKLCNGHLKQLRTRGEESGHHLRGEDARFQCQTCGTIYIGPPLGHLRDPDKQLRFVEHELTALLQAAGGTLPTIVKNDKGAFVLAEVAGHHAAPAAAKPAAAPSATPQKAATPAATSTAAPAKPAVDAKGGHAKSKLGPIPGADGPVPGETFEQKLTRLRGVVAEAKRRHEMAEAEGGDASEEVAAPVEAAAVPSAPVTEATPEATPSPSGSAAPAAAGTKKSSPIPGADGPVPGETFEQKLERLRGVVAAAKERAEREAAGE